jgi:hypothetical protein
MEQTVNEQAAMLFATAKSYMQRVVTETAAAASNAAPEADAALHFLVEGRTVEVDPTSCLQRAQTADADDRTIHSLDSDDVADKSLVDEPFSAREIHETFVTRLERGQSAQLSHALAVDSSDPRHLAAMQGLCPMRVEQAVAQQHEILAFYDYN